MKPALAILPKPQLIILDEPLNGLDVEGMIDVRNIIKKLADEQTTFFISSHLIHDVELTCNRIGVLFDGKILSVDYTENILNNYASLENYFVSEVERYGSFKATLINELEKLYKKKKIIVAAIVSFIIIVIGQVAMTT